MGSRKSGRIALLILTVLIVSPAFAGGTREAEPRTPAESDAAKKVKIPHEEKDGGFSKVSADDGRVLQAVEYLAQTLSTTPEELRIIEAAIQIVSGYKIRLEFTESVAPNARKIAIVYIPPGRDPQLLSLQ